VITRDGKPASSRLETTRLGAMPITTGADLRRQVIVKQDWRRRDDRQQPPQKLKDGIR